MLSSSEFVTDTYPDKGGRETLLKVDIADRKVEVIAELEQQIGNFGETRCDLHPQVNKSSGSIYIDSIASGKRRLYSLKKIKMQFSVLMAIHKEIANSHLDLGYGEYMDRTGLRPTQIILVVDGEITDSKERVIEK